MSIVSILRRRTVLAAAASGLALAAVTAAAPADAYTSYGTGGTVVPSAVTITSANFSVNPMTSQYSHRLTTPGPLVYRTIPNNQRIDVEYVIWKSTASGTWYRFRSLTGTTTITTRVQSARVNSLDTQINNSPGYYMVDINVTWYSAVGARMYTKTLRSSTGTDFACMTSACWNDGIGHVYLY